MDSDFIKPGLYVVPTPIGNLKDITVRAIETLKKCDSIFCEDTRVTSKLLNAYGIQKPLFIYQDHNEQNAKNLVYDKIIQQKQAVCLVSDAGTPLICDPGYKLISFLQSKGVYVTFLPGPCAAISAIGISGMPSEKFFFAGFFNDKQISDILNIKTSIIFYESPKRILKTVEQIRKYFINRKIALVREISKIYEEVIFGDIDDVLKKLTEKQVIKGEFVIVIGPQEETEICETEIEIYAKNMLLNKSVKDVVSLTQNKFSISKKQAYKIVLNLCS